MPSYVTAPSRTVSKAAAKEVVVINYLDINLLIFIFFLLTLLERLKRFTVIAQ